MPEVDNDCHAYVLKTQLRESIDINKQIEVIANKGIQENVIKGTNSKANIANNNYNLSNLPNNPISIRLKNDPKKGTKNPGNSAQQESDFYYKLKAQAVYQNSKSKLENKQDYLLLSTDGMNTQGMMKGECVAQQEDYDVGFPQDVSHSIEEDEYRRADNGEYMEKGQSLNVKRMGRDLSEFEGIAAKKQLVDPVKYAN